MSEIDSESLTLILHVGMGKTGSTSIQQSLLRNKEFLREQGACYLGMWPEDMHPCLGSLKMIKGFVKTTDKEKSLAGSYFGERLCELATGKGYRRFIYSQEALSYEALSLRPFLRAIVECGVSIRVVIYIRHPCSWLRSAHAQWGVLHKMMDGPIKTLSEFGEKAIEDYCSLANWKKLEEELVSVEYYEYDISVDTVESFAKNIGVRMEVTASRAQRRLGDSELVLRGIYNERFDREMYPDEFNSLFERYLPSSGIIEAMAKKCLDHAGLLQLVKDHSEEISLLSRAAGFDVHMLPCEETLGDWSASKVREGIQDFIVALCFDIAEKIERLEKQQRAIAEREDAKATLIRKIESIKRSMSRLDMSQ